MGFIGTLSLAIGLAFGLGSRGVAADLLDDWYARAEEAAARARVAAATAPPPPPAPEPMETEPAAGVGRPAPTTSLRPRAGVATGRATPMATTESTEAMGAPPTVQPSTRRTTATPRSAASQAAPRPPRPRSGEGGSAPPV